MCLDLTFGFWVKTHKVELQLCENKFAFGHSIFISIRPIREIREIRVEVLVFESAWLVCKYLLDTRT